MLVVGALMACCTLLSLLFVSKVKGAGAMYMASNISSRMSGSSRSR